MFEHERHFEWITGMDRVHNAVVAMEGFDHTSNANTTAKGWSTNPNSMVTGRFSGQAARLSNTTVRTKTLPSNYSTIFMGFAFRLGALSAGTDFAYLRASTTNELRISVDASNHISIRNSGGTVVASGTTTISANTWYYLEVKCVIAGASGSVTVQLNGVSEITITTGNFGSSNIDNIGFSGASANYDFDDIYVIDTTGSAPRNTFLGDVRIATLMPTSDGAHTDWTPSSGSAHFSLVNETTPDDDTTYVSDATVGHIDTYGFADVDAGATVYGVQVNLYARKDDAATRQIAPVIRQSGSDNVGTTVTLTSSYVAYQQIYNQDPTSADWTAANVNADEFGVKTIA